MIGFATWQPLWEKWWKYARARKYEECVIYIKSKYCVHRFSQMVYLSYLYIWHPRDNEHQTELKIYEKCFMVKE